MAMAGSGRGARANNNQLSKDEKTMRSYLVKAARDGLLQIIQGMESTIKEFPPIYFPRGYDWISLPQELLRMAALHNKPDIVKHLIEKFSDRTQFNFVDINEPNPWTKKTPFHLAAYMGDERLADLMIKNEANPFSIDEYGGNVFQASAYFGTVDFARTLLEARKPDGTIKIPIAIDYQDKNGDTALMLAARKNKPKMVKFLLSKNADASIRNFNGYTAFHQAIMSNHEDIIKILIEHFVTKRCLKDAIEQRCGNYENSWTALQLASFNGNIKLLFDFIPMKQTDVDVDSMKRATEELNKQRKLISLRNFRQRIDDQVVSVFREFHPVYGKIAGERLSRGAVPGQNEEDEKTIRLLLMNSVISVNAAFEEYLHSLLKEAFQRAIDDNKFSEESVVNLLKEELNEQKGIKFSQDQFQFIFGNPAAQGNTNNSDGKPSKKKEKNNKEEEKEKELAKKKCDAEIACGAKIAIMKAVLSFKESQQQQQQSNNSSTPRNIADVLIALRPILEQRQKEYGDKLSRPVIEDFCDSFNKLFCVVHGKNLRLEKSINDLSYERFPITFSTPDMDKGVTITLINRGASSQEDSGVYKTLKSFSRLFYGMRCIFAHGNPEPTLRTTLARVGKFTINQFGKADDETIEEIVKYCNTLATRITEYAEDPKNRNGTAYEIYFEDYEICLRIYGFTAWVLHWAILKSLGIWKEIPECEEDHKNEYCLPTL